MIKRDVPMKILLTADQRRMLEWLSQHQRRSMNDVVRLSIERIYYTEMQHRVDADGNSVGRGLAKGTSG